MKFYNIKDNYINYLRTFDKKVAENKSETRPYVGIVLAIDDILYFAPFTSPKNKHLIMDNMVDFRKIANGKYGAINLNNMIPVPEEALIYLDFNNIENTKYRMLLINQYKYIKKDKENIIKAATKLRNLLIKPNNMCNEYELVVKDRCCNLVVLEKVFKEFKITNL